MGKFKYIKVSGGNMFWGENTLTKEMLQMVANHQYETIINTEEQTYFDADDNEWKEIEGTP